MSRSLRDERGGILVLAAVMIPVFLLFTALVVDVGDWFTHKRQLQNRADAAAFAAGVEYAKNWKACVQSGNAALKLTTAREIADMARQYAADPEASDYASGALPSALYNTEIANQSKLDVVINSTSYTDDTDNSDGGVGNVADPCFTHPRRRHLSRRRALDGRQGARARPPVAVRRVRPAARAEPRPRAGRDPPRDQRTPLPAARGSRTT